jgi:hypothetical protein
MDRGCTGVARGHHLPTQPRLSAAVTLHWSVELRLTPTGGRVARRA